MLAYSREGESASSPRSSPFPPTPLPSVPFFHFMCSSNIHTPLIATAHLRPSPPAPCSEFFFPWIFASNHADGPLALPDGPLVPPPPPASLLFHSKMASAPQPLVCGCIFRLVVVSVPHRFGTFFSAPRPGIPVSSGRSRIGGGAGGVFSRAGFFSRALANQNRTSFRLSGGTARGRGRAGYGGMVIAEVGGRVEGRGG